MSKIVYRGSNLESIKDINRTMLLRLIKMAGVCSRAELAKQTGLTPAAVTKIVNDFIDLGLVCETGWYAGQKGRRSVGLTFNAENYYVIGVRLTRRFFIVGLFDISGALVYDKKIKILRGDAPEEVIDRIRIEISEVVRSNVDRNILAIGVSVPGPYYPGDGKMDNLSDFPGWADISLVDELSSFVEIPVIIDHDANAGALAEWWIAENGIRSGTMVYLALGQGIGAGIVNNGQVYRGGYGTAGEIGHSSIRYDGEYCSCGNRGCLNLYASTISFMEVLETGREQGSTANLKQDFSLEDVKEAINLGDTFVLKAFEQEIEYITCGIINIICSYGPDEIVLGDEMAFFGDVLLDSLKKNLRGRTWKKFIDKTQIRLCSFSDDSAYVGAAALAIDYALGKSAVFNN